MTHARTLPRYVGIAGLVAGLLAPVSSLASPTAEIRGVQAVGSTASSITTQVSAAYRFSANDPKYYQQLRVAVSRETLRRGALAVLSRGLMHPGLQLAILAAGLLVSESGDILKPSPDDTTHYQEEYASAYEPYLEDGYSYASSVDTSARFPTPLEAVLNHVGASLEITELDLDEMYYRYCWNSGCGVRTIEQYSTAPTAEYVFAADPVPATEDDIASIDPHLPDSIVDDFWADDPAAMPEPWADAISVLPFSNIDAAGQVAPEAHQAVSNWAENMTAKLNDEPLPHPETDAQGNTAEEQQLEEWDKPAPPFAETNPEWQVETIDSLPDYDIGLGSGSCPAPTAITLPAPFDAVIELDWQPLCDFASMIRGVVIAVCLILSLYIVLRSA